MTKVSMPGKIFGTVLSHGVRGRLLSKNDLRSLAESRDMEELVTRMKNTVYLDALAKVTRPYSAENLEGALREYLVETHAKMLKISAGSGILSAYFVKYIIWNLKIVLKGKALGNSYDDLAPSINLRAEELVGRRDMVVKALVANNLEEAVARIAGSEFGEDASKAAAAYKEKGDLRLFDVYLDHVYYHQLGKAMAIESQSLDVRRVVSTEIDSYNVLAVLRGKYWGMNQADIQDLIVTTTTKVTRDTLQKMINAETVSDAIEELANTVYKEIIPQAPASDIDAIMHLEASFATIDLKRIISSYRIMFSVAIMIAALKLMGIEIKNLSTIVTGVEQKIPIDRIVSRLVLLD